MDESRVFNPLNLTLSRSLYHWTPHNMGTCLAGRLIPTFQFQVLPGDEFAVNNLKSLFKMSTPVYPTMDYLYADIAFYFVPYKLIMSRRYASPTLNDAYQSWEGFIGAQDANINMPIPQDGVLLPGIVTCADSTEGVEAENSPGSLANYLYGIKGCTFVSETSGDSIMSALPFMSYVAIWNENYREPNLQPVVTWAYMTQAQATGDSGSRMFVAPTTTPDICLADCEKGFWDDFESVNPRPGEYYPALGGRVATGDGADLDGWYLDGCTPLPTSVFHGYFGSLLPWPQRNLAGITIPVAGLADVIPSGSVVNGSDPLKFEFDGIFNADTYHGLYSYADTGSNPQSDIFAASNQSADTIGARRKVFGTNLKADLSRATGIDIELLRALITKQHWYEDIARSGNRLDELEYGTFGVRPKDSGCDRPMYLGGKRIQLNVDMVASTNGGSSASGAEGSGSLGELGAFSHTNDEGYYFHQGFDTWGMVMCVFTIRAHNLIASGVDRMHLKKTRDDWFWPEFANLGNEAVFKSEIAGVGFYDNDVLGYQEYAEEWREPRDMVSGLLYPTKSLGFMTYAQTFDSYVTLAQVLDASRQYLDVDRTLAVKQSASGFQFIYQMTADMTVRRSVGKYSVPGVDRV